MKERQFDIIILGGGAAGMMCACTIKGKSVAVVDGGSFLAKKLMVTGNGRCNLTNTKVASKFYNKNLDQFLNKFNQKQTLSFFKGLGLETYSDEEGRVYPISNSAKSVVDVLNLKVAKDKTIFVGEKVMGVKKSENRFIVMVKDYELSSKFLVVATGGNSVKILESLGVEYRPYLPSLVSLKSNGTRDLNGIRVSNVFVTAVNERGETKSERGEVLFRENGLSGIVVFNLSTLFARANNYNGEVMIDLLPEISRDKLIEILKQRKKLQVVMDKFFTGMFVGAVSNEIFKQAKLNTNKSCEKLDEKEIGILATTIKALRFYVNGYLDNNQVFCGGVPLEELDENLMYKKIANLYFAGEICDVDGECGGFNLQWAWTSGHVVGEALC